MSKLPNPIEYKEFQLNYAKTVKFNTDTKYNLSNIYEAIKQNALPKGKIVNIVDIELLNANKELSIQIINEFILFDRLNNSIAIALKDRNNEIQTIAIHRVTNDDNTITKWKSLGSKKYIQYKIKNDDYLVYIAFGMAEVILFELLEVSYICFQSDSIAKNLQNHNQWNEEIKPLLQDKLAILLIDNDDSCRSVIPYIKEETNAISLEMEQLEVMSALLYGGTVVNNLPRGFDFRDFANKRKDKEKILNTLFECIESEIN